MHGHTCLVGWQQLARVECAAQMLTVKWHEFLLCIQSTYHSFVAKGSRGSGSKGQNLCYTNRDGRVYNVMA